MDDCVGWTMGMKLGAHFGDGAHVWPFEDVALTAFWEREAVCVGA